MAKYTRNWINVLTRGLVNMKAVKPPYWARVNHLHPLARGLVLYLPCNEGTGTRVNDLSGNRNTGTIYDAA